MVKEKKVIRLILKQVIKNALAYLDKNKLQLCNPELNERCKYYSEGGYKCVIGASLSKQQGVAFDSRMNKGSSTIDHLIDDNVVESDEPRILQTLQECHDRLVKDYDMSITDKKDTMRAMLKSKMKYCK